MYVRQKKEKGRTKLEQEQIWNGFKMFPQYNTKHVPDPKFELINWKPNPPIAQNFHQHTSPSGRTEIKCTEPILTDQQQHLSDLLSSFYADDSTRHDPPLGLTPCSPCVTHDDDDDIETALSSESFKPQITAFSNGNGNQVPVSQPSLKKNIIPLFPDYDQELSPNDIRMLGVHW